MSEATGYCKQQQREESLKEYYKKSRQRVNVNDIDFEAINHT